MKPPQPRPCGSCPYRRDVPSGVWHPSEYQKLAGFDFPTAEQPQAVFLCHQQDGHLCAGWVGCHDMENSLGLKVAVAMGHLTSDEFAECLEYETPVPLWGSGTEALQHGMQEIQTPGQKALRVMDNLRKKGLASDDEPHH